MSTSSLTADDTASPGLAGAETVLLRAMALYRVNALLQASLAIALDLHHYASLPPVLTLLAALAVENAALIALCLRRGSIQPAAVTLDTLLAMAGLFVGAQLTTAADGHTWVYFMYPFTLLASLSIGFAYRQLATVLTVTFALALAYVTAAITVHHDPAWNTIPNAMGYPVNTTVAWAAARYLRTVGARLDTARTEAVAQADHTAREQIRARHARALHDKVLQTLETLATGDLVPDERLRAHVAADAAWLRAFIEDDDATHSPTSLIAGLHHLAQRMALTGLHVELHHAALHDLDTDPVSAPHVQALLDAAGEALTNVSKHAGVTHAAVRTRLHADTLEITIRDRGRGFNPAAPTAGHGLRTSITDRMREIGATAAIETGPGQGTVIRLTLPTA